MQLHQLPRDFLLFLFAIYFAQGSLYPSGSIISQIFLLLIFAISSYYFVITLTLKNKNNLFYNAWTLLIILNIIGFFLTADTSDFNHISIFKNILGCMLPFYPFYYFAKNDQLRATHLIRFFLVMIPIFILKFFYLKNVVRDMSDSDMVNQKAYMFVSLIPFIFLIKKKKLISGALMTLIIIFVIQGAKRGAIIAGSIGLLMYFNYQIKTIEGQNRLRGYLVAIIFISFLSVFAYRTYVSNEFLIDRMTSITEGNLSSRDLIYERIFNKWYDSENAWNFLAGYGFAASLDLSGSLAHNDWLELLSNFGLIGISIYLVMFYAALKLSMKKEWLKDKRVLMLTITMIWFSVTLFSMWYSNLAWFSQAVLLGYLIGSKSKSIE